MKMVQKKTKKDEKGPPKDHFDPLLVESNQVATAVLMLESAEEEILLKSTQAIYSFVHKCDANKRLLLELGSIPQLLKLVQSEHRAIHRNACMALGTMSQLSEVGRVLKKLDETVPAMIHLLNPDEEAVVHEYAALCLSNLAKYFTVICQIRENNGLEGLVRCLSSSDQDVRNNAIEAVALMLEDYQTKIAIRELHGLPPVLELVKSDYPDIQLKALNALQRITEEVPNRTALRELGAIAQLVDFVATPVYSDFHVLAIDILANCFEDVETIKVIRENGVLSRLIAVVTDVPPPPPSKQDDKKLKKDKSSSRAGRPGTKNKIVDDKSASKLSLDGAAQVVPTLPEVKEKISLAVMRVAKNVEIRKQLQEHEIEKMLIIFLSHPDEKVQIAASQAVRIMAENLLSRDCTGRWSGIPPLVKMTVDGSDNAKEAAVMALNLLTTRNDFNCQEVAKSGGLMSLLSLLSSSREIMLTHTLGATVNLAREDDLRQQLLQNRLIPALVKPLSSQSCDVQSKASLAVAAFILTPEHRQQFIEVNGMQPLVMLLDSSNDEVRRNSTKAIIVLTDDTPTAEEICRLGGLDVLRHLLTLDTMRNAFTDEAYVKLLENNLSAKYALIGKLCPNDITADGFYDMGRVRPGNRFMPLLEYHVQPVNGNRPVIFVYAPTKDTQDIWSERRTCEVRKVEITEDQPKPDAAPDAESDPCPPCRPRVPRLQLGVDSQLVEYINTILNILKPFEFCSLKERSILLARFVAEKMGGPIEKGKLINFSWELLLSQLKFQLKSNIIPLGLVTRGIHYHRSLLFKVLGDRVGIPSSLVCSEYNHAWNELYIEEKPMDRPKYPARVYIIDLIYEPGLLMRADSPEAAIYMRP